MPRYRIDLSYKGTHYHGWQVQNNAVTVQGEINKALKVLLGELIATIGCGRTDTGVHARSYTAHFDCSKAIESTDRIRNKLNCILNSDISIECLQPVFNDFHARFDATARTYRYFIHTTKAPFLTEFSYFFPYQLDIAGMNEAAELLIGQRDFTSFSKLHSDVKTNICTVRRASWRETNDGCLVFEICADRFLRNMVRAIVGTLLDIGRGRCTIDELTKILKAKNRAAAGVSVPAQGLFLWKTEYECFTDSSKDKLPPASDQKVW